MNMNALSSEYQDLKPISRFLSYAIEDLESGDYLLSGRLCDDIGELSPVHEEVLENLFNAPDKMLLTRQMAARVCENCIEWVGCPDFLKTDQPVSTIVRFPVIPEDGMVDDPTVVGISSRARRLKQIRLKAATYRPKK